MNDKIFKQADTALLLPFARIFGGDMKMTHIYCHICNKTHENNSLCQMPTDYMDIGGANYMEVI